MAVRVGSFLHEQALVTISRNGGPFLIRSPSIRRMRCLKGKGPCDRALSRPGVGGLAGGKAEADDKTQ